MTHRCCVDLVQRLAGGCPLARKRTQWLGDWNMKVSSSAPGRPLGCHHVYFQPPDLKHLDAFGSSHFGSCDAMPQGWHKVACLAALFQAPWRRVNPGSQSDDTITAAV